MPQTKSYTINQLPIKAQFKANATMKHIINAHRKAQLGINMEQFELAEMRDIKFDLKGEILD